MECFDGFHMVVRGVAFQCGDDDDLVSQVLVDWASRVPRIQMCQLTCTRYYCYLFVRFGEKNGNTYLSRCVIMVSSVSSCQCCINFFPIGVCLVADLNLEGSEIGWEVFVAKKTV